MKRKIFAMLITVVIVLTLVPTTAYAATPEEAAQSLATSLGVENGIVDGVNVSLTGSATIDSAIAIPGGVVLTVEAGGALTVASGGSLTVESGGSLTVASGGMIKVQNGGTITVESGAGISQGAHSTFNIGDGGGGTALLHIKSGGAASVSSSANIDITEIGGLILSPSPISGVTSTADGNHLVTVDGNGGTFGVTEDGIAAYTDVNYAYFVATEFFNRHITAPTKSGNTFSGWNDGTDAYSNEDLIGGTVTISENTTLTAQWTEITVDVNPLPPPPSVETDTPIYTVGIVKEGLGAIGLQSTTAKGGDIFGFTATPNVEYELHSLVVMDSIGNILRHYRDESAANGYYFTMPASNVMISVEFVEKKLPTVTTLPVGGNTDVDFTVWQGAFNGAYPNAAANNIYFSLGAIGHIAGRNLTDVTSIQIGDLSLEVPANAWTSSELVVGNPGLLSAVLPTTGHTNGRLVGLPSTNGSGLIISTENLSTGETLPIVAMLQGSILVAFTEEYTNTLPQGTTPITLTMTDGEVHEIHLTKETVTETDPEADMETEADPETQTPKTGDDSLPTAALLLIACISIVAICGLTVSRKATK